MVIPNQFPMSSSTSLVLFSLLISITLCDPSHIKAVDLQMPTVDFVLTPLSDYSSSHDSKDVLSCERVQVSGLSRSKLGSFANSLRLTLVPSVVIPESLHKKFMVCFHRNASLGMCQCEQHEWKSIQNGLWSSFISPFSGGYVDVKTIGKAPGSVSLSIDEEFHQWRLYCLALGIVFILLAPIVSSWAPFYYSSSMVIGIFLVIMILLFQGMKLLPTGRKGGFYFLMSGSVIGAGSFVCYYFSIMVNSILVNFGLNEEMHHLVSIFLLIGLVLAGAALGYWMVRKFVISNDGTVDNGIALFVKWAMRIVSAAFFWQSTVDFPLAVVAFLSCWAICFRVSWAICFLINTFSKLRDGADDSGNESPWLRKAKDVTVKRSRAEFLSRSAKFRNRQTVFNSSGNSSPLSRSPIKGVNSPNNSSREASKRDYYSSFHKTGKRKKFSNKEWAESKRESTRNALEDLTKSPEFLTWVINNSERIQVAPEEDTSDEDTMQSGSDSTEEADLQSHNSPSLFSWR